MASEDVGKPRCAATTKAGNPCRCWPAEGSDRCVVHDPNHSVSKRFQPGPDHTVSPGRPKKPTFPEVVRQMIMEDPSLVLKPMLDARDAVIVLSNPREGVVVTDEPDHPTRLRAANDLASWGFAKPKDNQELSVELGVDGGVRVVLAFDPKPGEAE